MPFRENTCPLPAADVLTGSVASGHAALHALLAVIDPISLAIADAQGLDRNMFRRRGWIRVAPEVYAPAERATNPLTLLAAARLRLPPSAVFSGLTAAWLHGLDVAPCNPIEVTVPPGAGVSARSGLRVRRATLTKRDVGIGKGQPATSMERTLADLTARMTLTEAVVLADMALHLDRTNLDLLRAAATAAARRVGVSIFRLVAEHAEPKSESPMETRLRMVVVLGGLPRPDAQVPIHDSHGRFAGRVDLYYPQRRLGLEYDGGLHRDQLAEDNRRQDRLLEAGVQLLRFTAADVLSRPAVVVAQVRAILA